MSGERERRWCDRCEMVRIFQIRYRRYKNSKLHKLSDCVACKRRRGRQRSPEKISWKCMKERCMNPGAVNFSYYGGRGVKVHPDWVDSFEAFFLDVGPRPPGTTLDRIDPEGDYVPGNVRWATPKEQIANRRVNYKSKRKNYAQE